MAPNESALLTTIQLIQVTYKDAFEPYVVVRTKATPRFNEGLLERYADKALYIRTLHARG